MPFQKAYALTLNAASGADIAQRTMVAIGAGGTVATAGAGVDVIGVALEGYDDTAFGTDQASSAIPVAVEGVVEIVAGAAVVAGALVTPDAEGKAVTAASGDVAIGYALDAAAAADEVISVVITKTGAAVA